MELVTVRVFLFPIVLSGAALLAVLQRAPDTPQHAANSLPALIWRDPGDVAALNLIDGAGGRSHAPDPNSLYKFIREDLDGTNPKFDVDDAQGTHWKAKLGEEARPETAATRLLWAVGYFTTEDYYLPQIKVTGLAALRRGQSFLSRDGTVRGVRLKRESNDGKKQANWDWFQNPFLKTNELNGLRVMMAVLHNWDLSTANNAIVDIRGERRYMVSDVGATFGNTGNSLTRSKSDLRQYAGARFIDRTTADSVDFVMHSRPFVLSIVNLGNYRNRTRMEEVTKGIPRADARWIGERLGRLSEEQLRDAFRAGGYTPEEVEGYAQAIRKMIAELNAL
jgi:hypothetical protein